MSVLKYLVVSTILALLAACSSVPANSETDEAPQYSLTPEQGILCVQEALNYYGHEAGPVDGVISESVTAALARYEAENANVSELTEQTAVGLCDIMNRNIAPFGADVEGVADVELAFRLYAQDETTVLTEVPFTSGYKQLIYVGASQMKDVSTYCIKAPEGYVLRDTSGELHQETCDVYDAQDVEAFIEKKATLIAS